MNKGDAQRLARVAATLADELRAAALYASTPAPMATALSNAATDVERVANRVTKMALQLERLEAEQAVANAKAALADLDSEIGKL